MELSKDFASISSKRDFSSQKSDAMPFDRYGSMTPRAGKNIVLQKFNFKRNGCTLTYIANKEIFHGQTAPVRRLFAELGDARQHHGGHDSHLPAGSRFFCERRRLFAVDRLSDRRHELDGH